MDYHNLLTMIRSFGNRMTRDIYDGVASRHARAFPADLLKAARVRLDYLHYAVTLDDLRVPPGNRLEQLAGDLSGKHSIRINRQWRIVFRWTSQGPEDVEIIDYH
jgi:proteic killer suppression protein